MLSLCLRYVKDESSAEDVMVSAFVKVFSRIDQYKGEGSFEGWLRKIMVNEALGFIRKYKNLYLEVDIDHANYEVDLEKLESHMEVEELLQLIYQLPTGYRTIFNLYAIEGYSHKEIAEMLGISINTSKSQLSRARVILQQSLYNAELIAKKKISHEAQSDR